MSEPLWRDNLIKVHGKLWTGQCVLPAQSSGIFTGFFIVNIVELIYGKNQVKCPRCGTRLKRNKLNRTYINRCSKGCGVWIDQHQLEQLVGTKKRYEVTSDLPAQIGDRSTAV
jgi:uncharacterized C2H2 Zn-finger protein